MKKMDERGYSSRVVIRRSPEEIFAWVADYRHVRDVLEGVVRWEPLGERTVGLGARFGVTVTALGFPLDSVLVLDRWEEPVAIGWRSESGLIEQRGGWTFRRLSFGTEVQLAIGYRVPAGFLGDLLVGQVEGLLRDRLERALERTKAALEGTAAGSR